MAPISSEAVSLAALGVNALALSRPLVLLGENCILSLGWDHYISGRLYCIILSISSISETARETALAVEGSTGADAATELLLRLEGWNAVLKFTKSRSPITSCHVKSRTVRQKWFYCQYPIGVHDTIPHDLAFFPCR